MIKVDPKSIARQVHKRLTALQSMRGNEFKRFNRTEQ